MQYREQFREKLRQTLTSRLLLQMRNCAVGPGQPRMCTGGAEVQEPAAAFAEPAPRPSHRARGKRRRDTKAGRREQKRRRAGEAAAGPDADNSGAQPGSSDEAD